MSLLEASAQADAPAPQGRRWGRTLLLATTGLIIRVVGLALFYSRSYQPIGPAGFAQDSSQMRGNVAIVTDHLGSNTYIATGSAGTVSTVDYTLANTGRFDITILGAADAGPPYRMRLQWAPAMVTTKDGGTTGPMLADARPFPATIEPGVAIQLFVSFKKPRCTGSTTQTIDVVPIRWRALWVQHVTTLHLDPRSDYFPIAVCAPEGALRNALS